MSNCQSHDGCGICPEKHPVEQATKRDSTGVSSVILGQTKSRRRDTTIEEDTIDLKRYLGILFNYWWLLILLPTIGGLGGYFYSSTQDPVYEARATILVQYRGPGYSIGASDFGRSDELAATYTRLITSKTFLNSIQLDGVVPFGTGSLPSMVSAERDNNPPIINLRVKHTDPVVAGTIAQLVADQFIIYTVERRLAEIARLQSVAAAQGVGNIQDLVGAQLTAVDSLSLLDPVATPGSPIASGRRNILLGSVLGLVLAVGVALILENLTDTVRFPDKLGQRFGVTSLGSVFRWSRQDVKEGKLVMSSAPASSFAEALRQVRANLQFTTVNQPGNINLVTSPGPGEGKSTLLANLAIATAQTGKAVVAVDGDLRRPTLHHLFGSSTREPGLSNALADPDVDPLDIVKPTQVEGVHLLPSGPAPPNPAELLGSPAMGVVLDQLKNKYDMVFVDSPPVLLVADSSIMASQSDRVIIVVDGFGTRSSSLQASLDTLGSTQVQIAGVIVNKLKRARLGYGYTYPNYYYNSGYYSADDSQKGESTGYRRLVRKAKNILLPGRWRT